MIEQGTTLSPADVQAVRKVADTATVAIRGALDTAGMVDTVSRVGILLAAAHGEAKRAGWPALRIFSIAEQVWNQLGSKRG